jgi:ABC-type polysaccharide/polyol phosphate export permease
VLSPFFLMFLYVFVFRIVFDVPIPNYEIYLMSGLLPWAFLTQAIGRGIVSISTEPELIRKARFPYEFLPLSSTAAHTLNFGFTLLLFIGYLGFTGNLHYGILPMLVFPLIAVVLLVMSLSMIVALIDVYNHDLNLILGNLLTIWFFLIPIVYRPQMVPDSLGFLDRVDPMNLTVTQFRAVLYNGEIQDPSRFMLMLLTTSALFLVSLFVFRRMTRELAKDV